MKEKVEKIIEKVDSTKEIKRFRKLNELLNNNHEYISLMSEFEKNRDSYIKNNTYNEELINIRKKLFSIEELKEYLKLQSDLRITFTKVNNIILSVLD